MIHKYPCANPRGYFFQADLAARVSVCGGCIRAFRWSRGSFWVPLSVCSPHSGLDVPLLSSLSSLSFTTLPRFPFSTSEKNLYESLYFPFSFFFRSATPLEGIEGMCVRLSSSLSPDLFLICASFKLPLLAAAFPRYIPASLLRVMLWMESIGLLTPACSYQRLAVSIPISFPAYDPLSPLSPLLQL